MERKKRQNPPARARHRIYELITTVSYILAVQYGFIIAASGYKYITKDVDVFLWHSEGSSQEDDWRACEAACRQAAGCQSFRYNGYCYLSSDALIYGSLVYGGVSGQLESASANALLAWVGIGSFPNFYTFVKFNISTHALCQAACDKSEHDFECVGYAILKWYSTLFPNGRFECSTYSYRFTLTDESSGYPPLYGIRSDINTSATEIIGDVFNSRVAPKDFPLAPSDIEDTIPNYILADFHFSRYMSGWKEMAKVAVETWLECSIKCHRTEFCMSFLFWKENNMVTQCDLYDAAILGRVAPGFDTYGVIDKSQGEGGVSFLVGSKNYAYGQPLLLRTTAPTVEECAKLCHEFYEPRTCIAFFLATMTEIYDGITYKWEECYLFDALPCVGPRGANSTAFEDGSWNSDIQFGYFAIHYKVQSGGGCVVNETSARKEVSMVEGVPQYQMRLRCTHHCYHERAWCKTFVMDLELKICKLYSVKVGTNGNDNCLHGVATKP